VTLLQKIHHESLKTRGCSLKPLFTIGPLTLGVYKLFFMALVYCQPRQRYGGIRTNIPIIASHKYSFAFSSGEVEA
jgi:hypothetical protein